MTAQFAETLILEGQTVAMCSQPLDSYFDFGGIEPDFAETCTALWRGYIGTWEILDGRLYLIALRGTLRTGEPASLATIFPEYPERVFAHWYSGILRIPQGALLEYVHAGFGSIYEQDLLIDVENGLVINTSTHANTNSKTQDKKGGYGVGAMTVFPLHNGDRD